MRPIQVDNNFAVVIDDWFTPEEYKKAFTECTFISNYFLTPEESGSALKDGKPLKDNRSTFVSAVFRDWQTSFIAQYSQKKYAPDFQESLVEIDPIFKYLSRINQHDCLVSYYETSNYYEPHEDQTVLTMVTWLYHTPRSFTGGNLILRNKDEEIVETIECIPNRSVIFPSFMVHEVEEVSMSKKNLNKNKGRFTISQFSTIGI